MSTVEVELSEEETLAAAGDEPKAVYPNADATEDRKTGLLVIRRQEHVLAEYPKGRYVSWQVLEDEEDEEDEGKAGKGPKAGKAKTAAAKRAHRPARAHHAAAGKKAEPKAENDEDAEETVAPEVPPQ